ncbi:MAG: hypothetical protein ACP6IS_12355 [Candidatus Asgardarchaeia archaeon]
MNKKKKPRSLFDAFFGDFFSDIEALFEGGFGEGNTGYSIQVVYTDQGQEVRVKTYGEVDKSQLKAQLQQQYPNAKIVIEDEKGNVEEVALIKEITGEETSKKKREEKEKKKETKRKISLFEPSSKPLIREIKDNEG